MSIPYRISNYSMFSPSLLVRPSAVFQQLVSYKYYDLWLRRELSRTLTSSLNQLVVVKISLGKANALQSNPAWSTQLYFCIRWVLQRCAWLPVQSCLLSRSCSSVQTFAVSLPSLLGSLQTSLRLANGSRRYPRP